MERAQVLILSLLPFRSLGIFVLSSLTQLDINEYLAIDGGGNAHNGYMARMLPGEVELVAECTGLPEGDV